LVFAEVARKLQERGVTEIPDGLLADVSAYPLPLRPAGWPKDQLHLYYAAPTDGLVLQEGCVDVLIKANGGSHAALEILPAGLELEVKGRIALTADRAEGGRYHAALHGSTLRVSGAYWNKGTGGLAQITVEDPPAIFLRTLRGVLQAAGIRVGGEDRVTRSAASVPGELVTIHEHTTELRDALRPTLQDSSNFHAEMLLRALARSHGDPGSLEAGAERLQEYLGKVLPDDGEVQVVDGSGLARDNRVSPRIVALAVADALRGAEGEVVLGALAQAGHSGTLKGRLTEAEALGEVRAKTGWINGASTLSGYAPSVNGHRYVFAILMNYDPKEGGMNRPLKAWQDRIVRVLVQN
jgi:D-alanyl-D-alanine carboxypeptidase/D-alanyl-D-alanine-endopeptidase (penicillin-binding protein 4)